MAGPREYCIFRCEIGRPHRLPCVLHSYSIHRENALVIQPGSSYPPMLILQVQTSYNTTLIAQTFSTANYFPNNACTSLIAGSPLVEPTQGYADEKRTLIRTRSSSAKDRRSERPSRTPVTQRYADENSTIIRTRFNSAICLNNASTSLVADSPRQKLTQEYADERGTSIRTRNPPDFGGGSRRHPRAAMTQRYADESNTLIRIRNRMDGRPRREYGSRYLYRANDYCHVSVKTMVHPSSAICKCCSSRRECNSGVALAPTSLAAAKYGYRRLRGEGSSCPGKHRVVSPNTIPLCLAPSARVGGFPSDFYPHTFKQVQLTTNAHFSVHSTGNEASVGGCKPHIEATAGESGQHKSDVNRQRSATPTLGTMTKTGEQNRTMHNDIDVY